VELYHGSHNRIMGTGAAHVGICLTDDYDVACRYATQRGTVYVAEISFADLVVVEVDGYDRDSDVAPGDDGEYPEADVLVFEDEDERGNWHMTWRLVSDAAVAAVVLVEDDE